MSFLNFQEEGDDIDVLSPMWRAIVEALNPDPDEEELESAETVEAS